ncbi:MAG: hypothetical protein QOJ04_1736 [Caballeronia sp.]|nr:hypothetical protein [Caballeronia sp.]
MNEVLLRPFASPAKLISGAGHLDGAGARCTSERTPALLTPLGAMRGPPKHLTVSRVPTTARVRLEVAAGGQPKGTTPRSLRSAAFGTASARLLTVAAFCCSAFRALCSTSPNPPCESPVPQERQNVLPCDISFSLSNDRHTSEQRLRGSFAQLDGVGPVVDPIY